MSFKGMDLEQVEHIADGLETQAKAIAGIVGLVDSTVGALGGVWFGSDLASFQGSWHNGHKAQATAAATQMLATVTSLRTQIAEQRVTSTTLTGGALGPVVPGPQAPPPPAAPAEPVVVSTDSGVAHGEVTVPFKIFELHAGVDVGYKVEELSDGTYRITIQDGRSVGAGVGGKDVDAYAGVDVTAGESYVYHLPKGSNVEDFLKRALIADGTKEAMSSNPLARFGADEAYSRIMGGYQKHIESHIHEVGFGIDADGSVSQGINGVSGEAGYGVKMAYDDKQHVFIGSVDAHAGGSGAVNGSAGSVDGQVHGQAVWDSHGNLKGLSLSGDATAAGGVGIDSKVLDASATSGERKGFEITLDMTDPHVKELAQHYVAAVQHGDAHAVAQSLRDLASASHVSLTTETVHTQTVGIDAEVVSGSITHETTDIKRT